MVKRERGKRRKRKKGLLRIFRKMKQNYFQKTIKQYLDSFTKIKLLGNVFVFDLLFVIFVFLGVYAAYFIVKKPMVRIGAADLGNVAERSIAEIQMISSAYRDFFISAGIGLIVFFLFLIIGYSLFEGMAWCKILKKRFNLKYFGKFTLLNLIWFLSFIVLFFIFLIGLKQNVIPIILAILAFTFVYFTFILSVLFTQKNRFNQIKEALKKGFLRIPYFLLPLMLIFITSFLVSKINLIYKNLQVFAVIFNLVLFLLVFSWVKIYISDVIAQV